MTETLNQLLFRLSQDQILFQSNETVTRQGAILPILAILGWNVYNIREVIPEFQVGSGRIDYCLQVGDKKHVFLEVKRCTEDLERHEKQLLEYSFTEGVNIAILTNGLQWWFYLPLEGGNWQQRKFFTIDIRQQKMEIAAQHFKEFLSRENVANGLALQLAKKLKASKEKDTLINKTVPLAWEQLLNGPDEFLLEIFAEKVESMCGYRPEPDTLLRYIQNFLISSAVIQKFEPNDQKKTAVSENIGITPQRVILKINNTEIKANSVSDLYYQVLKLLYDNKYIEQLNPYLPYATSRVRYLLATKPIHQRGNEFRIPVEYKGYFMEAHKDYKNALKHLEDLLKLIKIKIEY